MSLKSARTVCVLPMCILALANFSQLLQGQDAKAKAETEAETEDTVVKLLELGEAPRQKLRLTPKKGMKQTALMKMKIDQPMVRKGQKEPAVPKPADCSDLPPRNRAKGVRFLQFSRLRDFFQNG